MPSFVTALFWLARTTAGHAQERERVDFEWLAPQGCPAAEAVQAEIDELLGDTAAARAHEQLSVRATVERGAHWQVTLETQSAAATGRRTIEAASCQALASATALIVALMIDPDAVATHAKQGAEKQPSSPPTKPPPPPPPPAPPPPPPPPSGARNTFGLVGLGAAGHFGVLPSPDASLFAVAGLVRGHWRAELRGAFGLRKIHSDPVSEAGGAYGAFRFLAATLTSCWTTLGSVVDLGPCAEVELGAVRGEGVGKIQVASETTPWLGVGAGGVVVLKASSWLRFPIHADAVVPLWRPSYIFRENSPIFRAWPVGGRLTAGVEARF